MLAELRIAGDYAALAQRARAKALALAAAGLDAVPGGAAGSRSGALPVRA